LAHSRSPYGTAHRQKRSLDPAATGRRPHAVAIQRDGTVPPGPPQR